MHESNFEPDNGADPAVMARGGGDAARFLRALANQNRLVVLCCLGQGEAAVSELLERVPLSRSALSQHLAVLRREGLVETRRAAQTIHYRVADERVERLLPVICEVLADGSG